MKIVNNGSFKINILINERQRPNDVWTYLSLLLCYRWLHQGQFFHFKNISEHMPIEKITNLY